MAGLVEETGLSIRDRFPIGVTPPVVLDPPGEDYHYLLDESRSTAVLPNRLNVRARHKTSQFLVARQWSPE
jgi:hypothetical protein